MFHWISLKYETNKTFNATIYFWMCGDVSFWSSYSHSGAGTGAGISGHLWQTALLLLWNWAALGHDRNPNSLSSMKPLWQQWAWGLWNISGFLWRERGSSNRYLWSIQGPLRSCQLTDWSRHDKKLWDPVGCLWALGPGEPWQDPLGSTGTGAGARWKWSGKALDTGVCMIGSKIINKKKSGKQTNFKKYLHIHP